MRGTRSNSRTSFVRPSRVAFAVLMAGSLALSACAKSR